MFAPPRTAVALLAAACATVDAHPQAAEPPAPEATVDVAPAPPPPTAPPPDPGEARLAERELVLRRAPSASAPERGRVSAGAVFVVEDRVEGAGCAGGWASVRGGAYACLDGTAPTDRAAVQLPVLVPFDAPEPEEYASYLETGSYDRAPLAESDALMPFVYAKPFRRWKGTLYDDLETYLAGGKPQDSMARGRKYSFVEARDTDRGLVLIRDDGAVAPAEDVFFYPVTRFQGRDLVQRPVPEGTAPAWAIAYDGTPMYAAPGDAEPARIVAYHAELVVRDGAVDDAGRWWEVPDGLAPGVPGYLIEDFEFPSFRRLRVAPPPEGTPDGAQWIDVDTRQQVLAVYEGEQPVYATMVSTGKSLGSPLGLFRVYDKMVATHMEGRPYADYDPYFVENVPWTMHFYPRYALHGAFWHWGFGHTASHGCINLAPRDASEVFSRIGPHPGPGWSTTVESPEDPGTLLRVRRDVFEVRDRRQPL